MSDILQNSTHYSRDQLAKLAFAVFYSNVTGGLENITFAADELDCHPCDNVGRGGECCRAEKGEFCPRDLSETLREIGRALYGPDSPSHYVKSVFGPDQIPALSSAAEIATLRAKLAEAESALAASQAAHKAAVEDCAAFAYEKHDWPPRWIASSLRGENDGFAEFMARRARTIVEGGE